MKSFYPKSLSLLIDLLSKLPGIGKKTAERLAFSLIRNKDTQYIYDLSESINKIKSPSECIMPLFRALPGP